MKLRRGAHILLLVAFLGCGHAPVKPIAPPSPVVTDPVPPVRIETVSTIQSPIPTSIPTVISTPAGQNPSIILKKGRKNGPVRFRVQPGDCLWIISERVYGDPFLWPIIHWSNRKLVPNPELILPEQDLVTPNNPSKARKVKAILAAQKYIGKLRTK